MTLGFIFQQCNFNYSRTNDTVVCDDWVKILAPSWLALILILLKFYSVVMYQNKLIAYCCTEASAKIFFQDLPWFFSNKIL